MLIIAGHFRVDATHRDDVVAAHRDLVTRARATDGCLDLAITADPVDPDRVNNFERWASPEAMEAFRARADPPELDVEMHDVEIHLYDASNERSPF